MSKDAVVAVLAVYVDGINIAATIEVTHAVVADLNKRFPTKHLGEVTWYMGSEYRRDREKGTLENLQAQFIRRVVDRFGITKTRPIPAFRRWTSGTWMTRSRRWTRISAKLCGV